MRLRSSHRPVLRTVSVLPTLVTAGNLLAGTLALLYLLDASGQTDPARRDALWAWAAGLVFIGLLCDGLDGSIARLMRSASEFGAQLDSLADVVTFGVVPAVLARSVLVTDGHWFGRRPVTLLVVMYVVAGAIRLARYNVESARLSAEGPGHVTLVFRGLPSPAAAGVIASLVLLRYEHQVPGVDIALLVALPVLALLMVSRLPYAHFVNRVLEGSRPVYTVVLLVVVIFLFVTYFHETIAAVFGLYALSGMILYALARLTGRPKWVLREEHDEASEAESAGGDAKKEDPSPSPARWRGPQ